MRSLEWLNGRVRFIDQTKLPQDELYVETDDYLVIAKAIKSLSIRGAPLIGIAAAYGVVLAVNEIPDENTSAFKTQLDNAISVLAATRPTAVNLFWALNRLRSVGNQNSGRAPRVIKEELLKEAQLIHREDERMCEAIGRNGADCLPNAAVVLTHCNTGMLATGGKGTAQGIISTAWEQHKLKHVYIDETRPLLQGTRLTAWELRKLGIPSTLITDNAAAFLMQQNLISAIVVGADRITKAGDVANKVGTYNLAVLAKHHNIPFFVAAPTSTIDFQMTSGKEIPIEERSREEVTSIAGQKIAPDVVNVYSPAFDITPNELVTAIVTERGILRSPFIKSIQNIEKME